jgi:hypothetical protein
LEQEEQKQQQMTLEDKDQAEKPKSTESHKPKPTSILNNKNQARYLNFKQLPNLFFSASIFFVLFCLLKSLLNQLTLS